MNKREGKEMDTARMIYLGSLAIRAGLVAGVTGTSFTVAEFAEATSESPEDIQELFDVLTAEDFLYRMPWAGGKHYHSGDAAYALVLDISDIVAELDPHLGWELAAERGRIIDLLPETPRVIFGDRIIPDLLWDDINDLLLAKARRAA